MHVAVSSTNRGERAGFNLIVLMLPAEDKTTLHKRYQKLRTHAHSDANKDLRTDANKKTYIAEVSHGVPVKMHAPRIRCVHDVHAA